LLDYALCTSMKLARWRLREQRQIAALTGNMRIGRRYP
jgi:hypothetical protein